MERGIWREGKNTARPTSPAHPGNRLRAGDLVDRAFVGKAAGWRGQRMRRLPATGWGCAEKRGGVVGAAVLAAVGEGAAAGFPVLRTDAIGAPGKVRIQPWTGPGEGGWNPVHCATPSRTTHPTSLQCSPHPGAEQSPSTQNPNPVRPVVQIGIPSAPPPDPGSRIPIAFADPCALG